MNRRSSLLRRFLLATRARGVRFHTQSPHEAGLRVLGSGIKPKNNL